MNILQINTSVNSGSTGRIAEDIGKLLLSKNYQSFIAASKPKRPSESKIIWIGNYLDKIMHGIYTRLFDRHGYGSVNATKSLIKHIEIIKPDAIGLHNLHGYYLNIDILFEYLIQTQIPGLWTLFDCWAFTGHCSYFDDIDCKKWETACFSCPKKNKYPASLFLDNSKLNYFGKKTLFTKPANIQLIVHSQWLKSLVEKSFLNDFPIHHIASGIDLNVFRPLINIAIKEKFILQNKQVILGVANIWDTRKGLSDFIKLYDYLSNNQKIVLVGLSERQIKKLPHGIIGIPRTESIIQLAELYSAADVFVNPTWQDNFPTTNLEALACGTPVITYNTGGSPEAIDETTGIVVEKGNIDALHQAINEVLGKGKAYYSNNCRYRAVSLFNKDIKYVAYLDLYETMLSKH